MVEQSNTLSDPNNIDNNPEEEIKKAVADAEEHEK
jgi:hypothetical protein